MKLTIEVTGPDIVLNLLKAGLDDSRQANIEPDSIFPGYQVTLIGSELTDD